MILGLRFEWETFKTVNINLWKSDKLDFKKLMNENVSGGLSKCGPSVGFSGFWKWVALSDS